MPVRKEKRGGARKVGRGRGQARAESEAAAESAEEVEQGSVAPRPSRGRKVATPAIVIKAAAILEEELANGLGVARRIEQRFIDVEQLRSQPPDALMSKFRRDAHDAVDILVDVIAAATTSVTERAGRIVAVTAGRKASAAAVAAATTPSPGAVQMPTVRMPGLVSAGETAELTMSLENDSNRATAEMVLHSSELVSAKGHRISADQVSFDPPTLTVGPRSTGQVTVRINVPDDTPPGTYEGLLRASQLESLRAMLRVQVR